MSLGLRFFAIFFVLDNSYLVCEFLIELRLGAEKIKEERLLLGKLFLL